MTLPTFITVGAEKCGTTALHEHLSQHPEIFMSEPKEPSYFVATDSNYTSQNMGNLKHGYIDSLKDYQAIFTHVSNEKAVGESSPCYLYSKIAAETIKRQLPDAKIIIILRNPMRRAFSQYVFNQMRGWESRDINFEQALAREPERIANSSMWAFHYCARGMYYEQVKRYLDTFGESNVKILLYDDFASRPQQQLKQVHQFLSVSQFKLPDAKEKHNVTKLTKNKSLDNMMNSDTAIKQFLKQLLPNSIKQQLKTKIMEINSIKPQVDENMIIELEEVFRDDIKKLNKIVNVNPLIWLSS